tara:strand:- start:115 stop:315 length:201 start_codon:yes stop_codon:yes gene_type:complete
MLVVAVPVLLVPIEELTVVEQQLMEEVLVLRQEQVFQHILAQVEPQIPVVVAVVVVLTTHQFLLRG